ncbi:MAG: hypothetical protein L3K14_03325 [Thermoplasmata archaeon]|nr:hypothetical protein [Thermoplasmata archaeon]
MDVVEQATGYATPYTQYIYKWAESLRYDQYFNDITSGCNGLGVGGLLPPPTGNCAHYGWDAVTGVGSPNAYALASGWTVGTQYTDRPTTATSISADIGVPNDVAIPGNSYAVVLGAYDNLGAYDMVGFSSRNGQWGFFFQVGNTGCAPGGAVNWDAYTLNPGQSYTFRETLNTVAQTVTLEVDLLDTTLSYASDSFSTSASAFMINNLAPCGTNYHNLLPGWSAAEIVGNDVGNVFGVPIPTWNFLFSNLKYCSASCTSIDYRSVGLFYSQESPSENFASDFTPQVSRTYNNPLFVTIANQPYSLSQDSTSIFVNRGSTGQISGYASDADPAICTTGCSVTLSAYLGLPSGVTGVSMSYSPASGTIPFSFTVSISTTSTATCGTWPVGVSAASNSMVPSGYTTFRFTLNVVGNCGGGGGCVASGSLIWTPKGWQKIDDLSPGAKVYEYDLGTGELVKGRLLLGSVTYANSTLLVNHGLLNLTLTEQPIWIHNATFTGWLRDPQNLTVGDQIFNVLQDAWVNVTNLSISHYRTLVFDVETSGLNTFIDAGFLLDVKKPH